MNLYTYILTVGVGYVTWVKGSRVERSGKKRKEEGTRNTVYNMITLKHLHKLREYAKLRTCKEILQEERKEGKERGMVGGKKERRELKEFHFQ